MMTVKIRHLWQGIISLRQKQVERGLQSQGLIVRCYDEVMTLPPAILQERLTARTRLGRKNQKPCHVNGDTLVDFWWKPDPTDEQLALY